MGSLFLGIFQLRGATHTLPVVTRTVHSCATAAPQSASRPRRWGRPRHRCSRVNRCSRTDARLRRSGDGDGCHASPPGQAVVPPTANTPAHQARQYRLQPWLRRRRRGQEPALETSPTFPDGLHVFTTSLPHGFITPGLPLFVFTRPTPRLSRLPPSVRRHLCTHHPTHFQHVGSGGSWMCIAPPIRSCSHSSFT
jgi:hypothetical protein